MEINIEKKHFYGILGLIILITSGIIIYANVDTSKPWHDASSIQVTINGQQMSLQEALENDLFTAQSEGGIVQETDPIWTSDKPNYATQTWVNNQNYATESYVNTNTLTKGIPIYQITNPACNRESGDLTSSSTCKTGICSSFYSSWLHTTIAYYYRCDGSCKKEFGRDLYPSNCSNKLIGYLVK